MHGQISGDWRSLDYDIWRGSRDAEVIHLTGICCGHALRFCFGFEDVLICDERACVDVLICDS